MNFDDQLDSDDHDGDNDDYHDEKPLNRLSPHVHMEHCSITIIKV